MDIEDDTQTCAITHATCHGANQMEQENTNAQVDKIQQENSMNISMKNEPGDNNAYIDKIQQEKSVSSSVRNEPDDDNNRLRDLDDVQSYQNAI